MLRRNARIQSHRLFPSSVLILKNCCKSHRTAPVFTLNLLPVAWWDMRCGVTRVCFGSKAAPVVPPGSTWGTRGEQQPLLWASLWFCFHLKNMILFFTLEQKSEQQRGGFAGKRRFYPHFRFSFLAAARMKLTAVFSCFCFASQIFHHISAREKSHVHNSGVQKDEQMEKKCWTETWCMNSWWM